LVGGSTGISVVIPVFNCERYLGEAIESVLAQTYRPAEILVVDDGSTDGSGDVARGYGPPVRYVFQPNSGAASARNRGSELAEGSFLSFLDSDDLWAEDKLLRQMACLDGDPQLDMVSGYVEHFISPDVREELLGKVRCPELPMSAPGPATMLIRRAAFFKVGLFETGYRLGETISWLAKAMERGLRGSVLPGVMVRRRLHLYNISRVSRDARSDYLRIARKSLERRRRHETDSSLTGTDPETES
jgi:glycosyltransferase involved in cell wall biosynthesis